MCQKCIEIDNEIAHFREVARSVLDPDVLRNIEAMIAASEDRKDGLHPESKH